MEERRAQRSQWKNEERNKVNGRTKSATKSMEERRMQQSQWKNEERKPANQNVLFNPNSSKFSFMLN